MPEGNFVEVKTNNLEQVLEDTPGATYVYVGTNYYIDSTNIKYLVDYVGKGNKAFIASTYQINSFAGIWLYYDTYYNLTNNYAADTVSTELITIDSNKYKSYQFYHKYRKKTSEYYWPFFSEKFFEIAYFQKPEVLSTINDTMPNFVKLTVGEGELFLYSTPILFSNYYLSKEDGFQYLSDVWTYIESDKIIWDTYSSSYSNDSSSPYPNLKESPLRFILKHKSLRWAWYTLIAAILLYVIFQSKRKQQVIPLIQKKKNNTLDYAKAIGALYFQAKSHRPIADEMIQQLYSYIKARYNIKITKDKDIITKRLVKLSGVEEKKINELFKLEIKLKYDDEAESEQLYKLYNLVDHFYKNCN